jgi:hypothetical protein
MADDDRKRAPGQDAAQGSTSDPTEVALPEHASAYFSPRSPPSSASHPTLETEAIRLDPAIDPDEAPTQPVKIIEAPAWLGVPLQSDAPTVLVPIVQARRRRRRLLAAVAAALVGVAAGVVYGFTRPLPAVHSPARQPAVRSADAPPTQVPGIADEMGAPSEPVQTAAGADEGQPTSETPTLATGTRPVPTLHPASKVSRPAAGSPGAPSAWLKSEPPKPWFK